MIEKVKNLIKQFYITKYRSRSIKVKPLSFEKSQRVIAIAPHPDDEVFGCGGLISRLVSRGAVPHIIVLTGGGGSHRSCCSTPEVSIISARRKLTHKAMAILGLAESQLHEMNFADGHLGEGNQEERQKLKALIEEIKPDVILVPHHGEGWPDHLAARELGIELANRNTKVYEYCVWMWYYHQKELDWKNGYILRMTESEHQKKLEAIKAYHSALAPCGKPWVGVLPKLFVDANSNNLELFFKIK